MGEDGHRKEEKRERGGELDGGGHMKSRRKGRDGRRE